MFKVRSATCFWLKDFSIFFVFKFIYLIFATFMFIRVSRYKGCFAYCFLFRTGLLPPTLFSSSFFLRLRSWITKSWTNTYTFLSNPLRTMKYTPTKRASALALLLAAAASPVHAILNCKIQLDGDSFDFSSLGDTVHSIEQTFNTPPSISTTSWYVNPCRYLSDSPHDNIPEEAFKCPSGTQSMYIGSLPLITALRGNRYHATISQLGHAC